MVHQPEPEALLALAVRAAGRPRATIDWQEKGPTDFVSEVDLGAEAAILGVLRPRPPGADDPRGGDRGRHTARRRGPGPHRGD